jgi:hypothetical protein
VGGSLSADAHFSGRRQKNKKTPHSRACATPFVYFRLLLWLYTEPSRGSPYGPNPVNTAFVPLAAGACSGCRCPEACQGRTDGSAVRNRTRRITDLPPTPMCGMMTM